MTAVGDRIESSKLIGAPAHELFAILADPARHVDFDGSGMLRGAMPGSVVTGAGDTFTMKMHRLGDDYLMLNHVVEFVPNERIAWEPSPGDASRAENNDPANIGVPAGYRWGYELVPERDGTTVVTEFFECGSAGVGLLRDEGLWVNGHTSLQASMKASLELLGEISCQ